MIVASRRSPLGSCIRRSRAVAAAIPFEPLPTGFLRSTFRSLSLAVRGPFGCRYTPPLFLQPFTPRARRRNGAHYGTDIRHQTEIVAVVGPRKTVTELVANNGINTGVVPRDELASIPLNEWENARTLSVAINGEMGDAGPLWTFPGGATQSIEWLSETGSRRELGAAACCLASYLGHSRRSAREPRATVTI